MLGAALISVTIFRKLKLGATLGYIVAGIIIGPQLLGLFGDADALMSISEIGIAMLLVGIIGQVTFGLAGLLDVLWPLWDEENRALHDMVVNTRVVKA